MGPTTIMCCFLGGQNYIKEVQDWEFNQNIYMWLYNFVDCSYQPSSILWLSSSIYAFVSHWCLFFSPFFPLLFHQFYQFLPCTLSSLTRPSYPCFHIFLPFNLRWAQLYVSLIVGFTFPLNTDIFRFLHKIYLLSWRSRLHFLKKEFNSKVKDLDSTEDGKASEESHCTTNDTQLSHQGHLWMWNIT